MTTAAPPRLRWSQVASCPRMAVYSATDAPKREHSDREQRILWRGRSIGQDYAAFLEHKFGPKAVRREVKVEWELGVGHIDVVLQYDPETPPVAIEVLSSAHASDAMISRKLLQLVGYMERFPEAGSGLLVVIDPSDFTEERFPLAKTSERYAELVREKDERVAALLAWNESGDLPERVCAKPADAIGHFCLHSDHCFEGWQPPELPSVDSPDILALVSEFREAKQRESSLAADWRAAKVTREGVQAGLAAALEGQPEKVQVGGFAVTRTDVQRQPTFDWRKAEAAGVFQPGLYDEFFKPGASYSTWKVELTEFPVDIDYGEVPF